MRYFLGALVARLYGFRLITLGPDDVVLLSVPQRVSLDQAANMKAVIREVFGARTRALVLDGGIQIGVARKGSPLARIAGGETWPPVPAAPPPPPPERDPTERIGARH